MSESFSGSSLAYVMDQADGNQKQRRHGWLQLRLLQAISASDELNQQKLASAIGVDKSQLSRFINHGAKLNLDQIEVMFDLLGMDTCAPDADMVTIHRDELAALRTLARKALA